jgi:DNA-binding MarR family transcriptional regulator
MKRDDVERMADGIVRLRAEVLRRRAHAGPWGGAELTTPQALALRTVAVDGPLRMSALAERLGVSVATASRTVDALAARGLVKRLPDPDDARAVKVCATARGKREQRARRDRFVDALDDLLEELSESERRRLAEALETLTELFSRSSTPERPPATSGRAQS